jgi:hypothetical protein
VVKHHLSPKGDYSVAVVYNSPQISLTSDETWSCMSWTVHRWVAFGKYESNELVVWTGGQARWSSLEHADKMSMFKNLQKRGAMYM